MKRTRGMAQSMLVLLVVAVIAGCAGTRTTESTGQYVDGSAITAKVKAAILDDPSLKVFQIGVETYKDVVQLSGFVNSSEMRSRAAVVASRVSGVRSVQNDLIVR
jgi:osmotically-inducible protein OsmY